VRKSLSLSLGSSFIVKGKVYRACVQSVLRYVSGTLAMKVEDMARSDRTERVMVRRMCGVHLKSKTARAELNSRLGIECVRYHKTKHTAEFWSCGEKGE